MARATTRIEITRRTGRMIEDPDAPPDETGKRPVIDETEPTGRWADVWERPTTGEIRDYVRRVNKSDDRFDTYTVGVLIFTSAWNLTDETGEDLPLDKAGIDRADAADIMAIFSGIYPIIEPGLSPNI